MGHKKFPQWVSGKERETQDPTSVNECNRDVTTANYGVFSNTEPKVVTMTWVVQDHPALGNSRQGPLMSDLKHRPKKILAETAGRPIEISGCIEDHPGYWSGSWKIKKAVQH